MKTRLKRCSICETEQDSRDFPRKTEYCLSCEKKHSGHFFIYGKNDVAIDAADEAAIDRLVLAGAVSLRRGKYRALDDGLYLRLAKGKAHSLSIPPGAVLAVGKYGEKKNAVSLETAKRLVEEGAAVFEGDRAIRHLFSGKELEEHVVARDKGVCHVCKGSGDRLLFLKDRTEDGLLSPANSVCGCKACKEEQGENLFFFKWLNAPVLRKSEASASEERILMFDKRRQSSFLVSKETAQRLAEEEMAEWFGEGRIAISRTPKEFASFIMERDERKCRYCGKEGNTIDHVFPQEKGGMTTPKNCVCACKNCNRKKGNSVSETTSE